MSLCGLICYTALSFRLVLSQFLRSRRGVKICVTMCLRFELVNRAGIHNFVCIPSQSGALRNNVNQILYHYLVLKIFLLFSQVVGRLCGLVVRVPGYRSRGPGFDSRRYQIFWEVVGQERGLLTLVRITEEVLESRSSGFGSRKLRLTAVEIRCADHTTPSIRKSCHYADERLSLGRCSSLAD
jgi:hypothetical protein